MEEIGFKNGYGVLGTTPIKGAWAYSGFEGQTPLFGNSFQLARVF